MSRKPDTQTREIEGWQNSIQTGDCLNVLGQLPESSIHMCMTSPPYWNLRDYGHDEQLGLEEKPDEYIEHLADVFDSVRRVLRPDGSLWLNLGDTYLKKDLQQIPARVAIELQNRGWILRNRVTWNKPNPMPNSVKDRLNTTTEAVFHLTPSKRYWYDLDAIREEHAQSSHERMESDTPPKSNPGAVGHGLQRNDVGDAMDISPAGKNPGDVFEVTTKPFPDAHFAVYPPELCEKPIKASCPPKVCGECGSPYERKTEKTGEFQTTQRGSRSVPEKTTHREGMPEGKVGTQVREFKGWRQTCDCDTDATESGICLDPFAGAGTTLLKAKELGRRFVGIELNPEYADMARARIGLDPKNPSQLRNDGQKGIGTFDNKSNNG